MSIQVAKVEEGKFTKKINGVDTKLFQAELRSETILPASGGNLLFTSEELGLQGGKSTRVCWIDAPVGTTVEQVEAMLAKNPNLKLQQVLSFNVEDTLTETQKASITAINPSTGSPYSSIEKFKESRMYQRNINTLNPVTEQMEKVLTPVLKDGKQVYRGIFLSTEADLDLTDAVVTTVEQSIVQQNVTVKQAESVLA